METLFQQLDQLSRLDLSTYPVDEIRGILSQLGEIALIRNTLHRGKDLIRARPHEKEDELFNTRAQLSYRPQDRNTNYRRASTPAKTMFYGCLVPEELGPEDFNIARITAFTEASNTFRNNPFLSEEKITYGRWQASDDINLVMLAFHPRFLREGSQLKSLNDEFKRLLKTTNTELLTRTLVVSEFLSDQFAKAKIRDDFDYLISALFTEMIVKSGYDGVYYPSVQSDGRGYNVALTPETTDTKLKLIVAGEGRIYKRGKRTLLENETQAIIEDDSKEFSFEEIPDKKWRRNRDEIIEDLKKYPSIDM